jgi:glutathione S-transferase
MHARLYTIAPSHFCEKARWALRLARLPFAEEVHLPLFHMRHLRRATGQTSTPALVLPDGASLTDSTDILGWIQAHPDAAWRPYGEAPAHEAEIRALEDLADTALGPHSRRVAYFHLLGAPPQAKALVKRWAVPWESALFHAFFPIGAWVMRRGLRITPDGTARSLARVEDVFAQVGERLQDGRRWLVGDAFSAADLTFAALAGPLLLPPNGPAFWPGEDDAPPAFAELARRLRATPAGAHALRCFAEQRP